ncbi:nucleotide-diphospho-sugar transferase [Baffinella frigidus]|nr:nucleotide-diphospho-sugar transferase [Cryptophyta sp. CCMP2293]
MKQNKITVMKQNKITVMKQNKVPAMLDSAARFSGKDGIINTKPHGHGDIHTLLHQDGSIDTKPHGHGDIHTVLHQDGYINTKPHGHGDIHTLLHQHGVVKAWSKAGVKWFCFFQDTNGVVFRSLPAVLGVSVSHKLDVNSLCVPRTPGEAVGAICRVVYDA